MKQAQRLREDRRRTGHASEVAASEPSRARTNSSRIAVELAAAACPSFATIARFLLHRSNAFAAAKQAFETAVPLRVIASRTAYRTRQPPRILKRA
jgi:hypothetical protein